MISDILSSTADEIRGCKGILLMGKDGFVVEKHAVEVEEVDSLVVELLGILKKLDTLFAEESAESGNELTIEGNSANYHLLPLHGGYVLFMAADKSEFTGKIKFRLRRAATALNKELR